MAAVVAAGVGGHPLHEGILRRRACGLGDDVLALAPQRARRFIFIEVEPSREDLLARRRGGAQRV
jgi:hypothetical protein